MNANPLKNLNEQFGKVLETCPEIVYIGEKVLREPTVEVSLQEGRETGNRLKTVLETYRKLTGAGRGLAAPQIGENKAVFVTYVGDVFTIYINPRITQSSEKHNLYRESCISCGFLFVDVRRPVSITIEYTDEDGQTKTDSADGLLARLLQHEYDHLKGIINIDKAEPSSIEFRTTDPLQEKLRNIL